MEVKKYIKDGIINDGTFLEWNGFQIFNPSPQQYEDAGWTEYVENRVTEEKSVDNRRAEIVRELRSYFESLTVSGFWLNDTLVWISKSDRVAFKSILEDCLELEGNIVVRVPVLPEVTVDAQGALDMLKALNVYALKCNNVLLEHLDNLEKLETIEALEAYDYTVGYPEQLSFDI